MENLKLDESTRAVVTRMEHVHVQVADAARSIDFYRKVFGFEVRWDSGDAGDRCCDVARPPAPASRSRCTIPGWRRTPPSVS